MDWASDKDARSRKGTSCLLLCSDTNESALRDSARGERVKRRGRRTCHYAEKGYITTNDGVVESKKNGKAYFAGST